jgi:hypothetical protein
MATSSNAASCPPFRLDPSSDERVPTVIEHEHVTRLDVRRGMLDQAEVVAGRVVEAVGERHANEGSRDNPVIVRLITT